MENKKISILKISLIIIFAVAIVGLLLYVNFKGDIKYNILSFCSIVLSLLLALIFIRFTKQKIFIIFALMASVVAYYFLLVMPEQVKDTSLVFFCVLCGMQFFLMLYTLVLHKSVGLIITNLAFRVMLCLLAYFLLPLFYTVSIIDMISIMYMLNSFVSALTLLIAHKKPWLMAIGFLVLFAGDVFLILTNGAAAMLDLSFEFIDFLTTYNFAFYLTVAGLFLIAAASVFEKKIKKD